MLVLELLTRLVYSSRANLNDIFRTSTVISMITLLASIGVSMPSPRRVSRELSVELLAFTPHRISLSTALVYDGSRLSELRVAFCARLLKWSIV